MEKIGGHCIPEMGLILNERFEQLTKYAGKRYAEILVGVSTEFTTEESQLFQEASDLEEAMLGIQVGILKHDKEIVEMYKRILKRQLERSTLMM